MLIQSKNSNVHFKNIEANNSSEQGLGLDTTLVGDLKLVW